MSKPCVADIAGQIELRREADHPYGGKSFGAFWNGQRIGTVWQVFPTFERKTPGRMYVNARWTSKRPRWKSEIEGARYTRLFYETKRRAVEELVRDYLIKEQEDGQQG